MLFRRSIYVLLAFVFFHVCTMFDSRLIYSYIQLEYSEIKATIYFLLAFGLFSRLYHVWFSFDLLIHTKQLHEAWVQRDKSNQQYIIDLRILRIISRFLHFGPISTWAQEPVRSQRVRHSSWKMQCRQKREIQLSLFSYSILTFSTFDLLLIFILRLYNVWFSFYLILHTYVTCTPGPSQQAVHQRPTIWFWILRLNIVTWLCRFLVRSQRIGGVDQARKSANSFASAQPPLNQPGLVRSQRALIQYRQKRLNYCLFVNESLDLFT